MCGSMLLFYMSRLLWRDTKHDLGEEVLKLSDLTGDEALDLAIEEERRAYDYAQRGEEREHRTLTESAEHYLSHALKLSPD